MEIYLVLFLSLFIIEDHTWSEIEIDPQLSELEVDPNDWTYPWYVIKHEDYFENTFGEPITEEDTAHIIRNSFCNLITISDSNESSTRLPFAGARWRDDTLQLNIYQEGASGIVALELDILGEKFTPRFLIYYIHDPEEQSTAYLEQSLILHKLPEKGKPIKGEVNILLRERVKWSYTESEKLLRINGTFVIE